MGVVEPIVIFLACLTLTCCSNVTVSPSSSCNQPCGSAVNGTTIDQALGGISSGDYLQIQPGCHCVQKFNLVGNVSDISLIGNGAGVQITCAPGLGLAFLNVTRLTLQGLTITGCGLNGSNAVALNNAINVLVDLFIQLADDIRVAVVIASCTDVTVDHVTITNTTGIGLVGVNVAGQSNFTDNVFSFNKGQQCFVLDYDLGLSNNKTVGGGAQFIYVDYLNQSTSGPVFLNIDNNTFSYNSYCGSELIHQLEYLFIKTIQNTSYFVGAGGGLSLNLGQLGYSVDVSVRQSSFENNTATIGSAVAILWYAGLQNTSVVFTDCTILKNGAQINADSNKVFYATQGGIAILKDISIPFRQQPNQPSAPNTVSLVRTNFTGNAGYIGSCVFAYSLYSTPFELFVDRPNQITMDSCHFERNYGNVGPIFDGYEYKASGLQNGIVVTIQNCTFLNNTVSQSLFKSPTGTFSLVQLLSMNITIKDSSFLSNNGTAIGSLSSLVILEGGVEFVNNAGLVGGALHLSATSFLLVKNNSEVSFVNNSALYIGGAIYVDYSLGTGIYSQYYDCFLYFDDIASLCTSEVPCPDLSALNISMVFSNNTAVLGGALYGSTLDSCSWAVDIRSRYNLNGSILNILYDLNENKHVPLFHFDQRPNTSSVVSTPTNTLKADNTTPLSYMPGQQFNLTLWSADRLGNIVPSIAIAQTQNGNGTVQLGESGYWLTSVSFGDLEVPARVNGLENSEALIRMYTLDSLVPSKSLLVSLSVCSFGFQYNGTTQDCRCSGAINTSKVTCHPSLKVLSIAYGWWLGAGPDKVGVIYERCVFDYCAGLIGPVQPQALDKQCADNRAGLLCGGCQDGYSAVFGTNKCMKCTDKTLGLLVFFAAAGIGIIAIISLLHITVAEGYLTGVVFYSGVVVTYAQVQGAARQALIPLYFLNLNIGFETCFYDGMTPLARAGLGLVFPAYLFILMVLFIFLASRSLRLSEYLAKSNFTPSKLVATLIVLSYNSITQSCFQILGYTKLNVYHDDGSSSVILPWATDPNVEYFSSWHAVLCVISLALLITYIIPVPILLIVPSFTYRGVWRMKPLYDVFFSPFKEVFTFWLGVCLMIRIAIFTISAFFPSPDRTLYLGVVLMIAVFLKSVIEPFKRRVHNILDVFFLINLLVISLGSLYYQGVDFANNTDGSNDVGSIVFLMSVVGVAYAVICAVIVWHLILRFPWLHRPCRPMFSMSGISVTSSAASEPEHEPKKVVTFSEVNTT